MFVTYYALKRIANRPLARSRYTGLVDKVRLGRALGYGTRHMAKTVAAVAEAATSQPVAAPDKRNGATLPVAKPASPRTAAARGQVLPSRVTPQGLGGRARHLKRSVWQPLAVFSGALWLRVTGTFFALIASTIGAAAWRQHRDLQMPGGPMAAHHFWLFTFFTLLFGYFAVSSFVRATLRERRARIPR